VGPQLTDGRARGKIRCCAFYHKGRAAHSTEAHALPKPAGREAYNRVLALS